MRARAWAECERGHRTAIDNPLLTLKAGQRLEVMAASYGRTFNATYWPVGQFTNVNELESRTCDCATSSVVVTTAGITQGLIVGRLRVLTALATHFKPGIGGVPLPAIARFPDGVVIAPSFTTAPLGIEWCLTAAGCLVVITTSDIDPHMMNALRDLAELPSGAELLREGWWERRMEPVRRCSEMLDLICGLQAALA